MPAAAVSRFHESVLLFARKDVPLLRQESSVEEALKLIRERGVEERIIYFYVVDEMERLKGVLPTRRLLTSPLDGKLSDIMIPRVLAIPKTASLLDACELFVLHKFLAFPVIDEERRVVGVIDISAFTEEMLEIPSEPEAKDDLKRDDLFDAIGLHISQLRGASPFKAFQYRFPWLLTTITSGTIGALIAGSFEDTLAHNVVIACFLALVLALAEAVSMQSMTLVLQVLRSTRPTLNWFLSTAQRELFAATLLGAGCGSVVFLIIWLWRGALAPAGVIAGSVFGSLIIASLSGLMLPSALHALKLDPKIAAGPAALAVTDVCTLLLYLSLAKWLL